MSTGLDIAPTAQRVRWSTLDGEARLRVLQRPGRDGAQALARSVAALIDKVRGGGDDALRAITARLDGVALQSFEVSEAEFAAWIASKGGSMTPATAEQAPGGSAAQVAAGTTGAPTATAAADAAAAPTAQTATTPTNAPAAPAAVAQ